MPRRIYAHVVGTALINQSVKERVLAEGGKLLPGSVIRHYRRARGHLVLRAAGVTWSVTWCYLGVAWRYLGFYFGVACES